MKEFVHQRGLTAWVLAIALVAVGFFGLTNLAQAQQEETLVVGIQNDTVGLNPWDFGTNSIWKSYIMSQWTLGEGLYATTPAGDEVPILADPSFGGNFRPGIDFDGDRNFTVRIRPGVTFTDGDPMTADDVVFSYHVLTYNAVIGEGSIDVGISHDTPVAPRWNGTAGDTHSKVGVFKVNDTAVRFWLAAPFWGVMPLVISGAPIMPSHIWFDKLVEICVPDPGVDLDDCVAGTNGNLEYDMGADFGANNELQATVGTGPWMMESYTQFVGAELVLYPDHWGKAQGVSIPWAGNDYPLFPANVQRISIRIFGTLDVALLALSRGDVHIVPWNMGPSYFNALSTNPNLDFTIAPESGFFYIAFNMRKEPMSLWGGATPGSVPKDPINAAFRQAVGHVIDRDFIVDRLMGGFGVKGTVMNGILNPGYVNASAIPPAFDLTAANAVLDDPLGDGTGAGLDDDAFLDVDGDGFRDMPVDKGGGPLQFNILTPPKDYDPIRADAGIMISKNLKAVGLNIDATPTSFDTIVTAAFVAFDFDLYILGWRLGGFPEAYLRTFFHTDGGNNAPGHDDPAFDALLDDMDVEFDTATRQQIVKDAAGLLVENAPNHVLYYRQAIVGTRADQWENWVPNAIGEPYEFYSLSRLARPAGPVVPPAQIQVGLNMPAAGAALTTVNAQVLVAQGGQPVQGAAVTISSAALAADLTGVTNANGVATIPVALPFIQGGISLTATATSAGLSGGDIASINVIPRTPLATLSLSASPVVISPTDTATVLAKVTDEDGDGMEGIDVSVSTQTLVGTVDATTKATNATGYATFTYTPPSGAVLLNRHFYDLFKASISVPNTLVPGVQEQAFLVGIDNSARDWRIIDVYSVSNVSVAMGGTSDITIQLWDETGTALAGENVLLAMTGNTSAFTAAATNATTNATGMATFTVTGNVSAMQETNHTVFWFDHDSSLSITDSVGLIAWNGTDTNTGRAAMVDFDIRIADPEASAGVTVTLFNETGMAPMEAEFNVTGNATGNLTGTNISYTLPFVASGLPGHFDPGTYLWFLGSVSDGVSNTTTGTDSQSITSQSFVTDSRASLQVDVQAPALNATTGNWEGLTTLYSLGSDYVVGRAKIAAISKVAFDQPFYSLEDNEGSISIWFEDKDGPLDGISVQLFDSIPVALPSGGTDPAADTRFQLLVGEYVTNPSGLIVARFSADPLRADFSLGFSTVIVDPEFTAGFENPDVFLGGSQPVFEGSLPFEVKTPYLFVPNILIVTGSATTEVAKVGTAATFALHVEDIWGSPVAGATVVGGDASGVTDASGDVSLSIPLAASGVNSMVFTAVSGSLAGATGLGAIGGVGSFEFSNQVVPASVTAGEPATLSVDVRNVGPVADTVAVDLTIGGAVVASKIVNIASAATSTVTFEWTFTDAGDHSVSLGDQAAETVSAAAAPVAGLDLTLAIVLMVVLLIVGILVGWAVFRMMGGSRGGGGESPPMTE